MGLRSPQEFISKQPTHVTQMPEVQPYTVKVDTSVIADVQRSLETKIGAQKKQEDQVKKAQEDLALARLENNVDEKAVETEQKIISARGTNAFEVAEKGLEELDRDAQGLVDEQFRNDPILKLKAEKAAIGRVSKAKQSAITHSYSEATKEVKETFKTRVSNDTETLAMAGSMERIQDTYLPKLEESATIAAMNKYGKDLNLVLDPNSGATVKDLVVSEVEAVRSKALLKAVQYNSALGNISGAKDIANQFGNMLSSEDRKKAEHSINGGSQGIQYNQAKTLADYAISQFPTDADNDQALKYFQDTAKTGQIFRTAMSMYSADKALLNNKAKQDKEAIRSTVYDDYIRNNKINREALSKLSAEERTELLDDVQKIKRDGDQITDPNVFKYYMERVTNASDKELANMDDFTKVIKGLSNKDSTGFNTMRLSAIKKLSNKSIEANDWNSAVYNAVAEQLKSYGNVTSKKNIRTLESNLFRLYNDMLDQKSFRSTNEIRNSLFLEASKKLLKTEEGFWPWSKDKVLPVSREEYGEAALPKVFSPEGRDESWVQSTQQEAMKRFNRVLSDDELDSISESMKKRGR